MKVGHRISFSLTTIELDGVKTCLNLSTGKPPAMNTYIPNKSSVLNALVLM